MSTSFENQQVQATRSLRANVLWMFAGNALFSMFQWMMLVALAKLGNPVMLGQFALGLAIASPIVTFANLQLRAAQATDAQREYTFSEYFGLRTITTAAALLVIACIAQLGSFGAGTAAIILMVGVAKAAESFSDVFYGLFQRMEDLKRVSLSMVFRGAAGVAALSLVLYFTHSLLWATATMAAAWLLIWWVHDVRGGRSLLERGQMPAQEIYPLRPRYHRSRHVALFRLTFPLGCVIMLVALNQSIPRYFIQYHMGLETVGVFSAMAYMMVAFTGVVEALSLSATPKLAKYLAAGRITQFRSLLSRLVIFVLALGAGTVLVAYWFGDRVLSILYMPAYAKHADVFVWLVVAASGLGVANILSSGVTAARRFAIQVPVYGAVTLTSAVGCYFLVPIAGMRGAAIAVGMSGLVHILLASALLAWVMLGRRRSERVPFVSAEPHPAMES